MILRGQTDGMRLRRCGSRWWEFWILEFEFLIEEEIAHAKAAKEMIFNFECFPAVTGHAYAWIFD